MDMNIRKLIGNNINKLIKENNISQRKIAEIINITNSTLDKYISGEQVIDSEKLIIISNYFKVSFDYFFIEEHKESKLLFRIENPN